MQQLVCARNVNVSYRFGVSVLKLWTRTTL